MIYDIHRFYKMLHELPLKLKLLKIRKINVKNINVQIINNTYKLYKYK